MELSKQEMELTKQEMELFLLFSYLGTKKLILQNILHFYHGFQSQYLKQEMELSKQEMELFEVIIATLGSILDSQPS